jgi:N-methylhydantoinase A
MYALNWQKPEPLVPRRLRLEVAERIGPRGEVWEPLNDTTVRIAAERLKDAHVESVAVSLLHSYANPSHERRVLAILRDILGEAVFITCSSDILPIIREYERTSTTVINAYLGPI